MKRREELIFEGRRIGAHRLREAHRISRDFERSGSYTLDDLENFLLSWDSICAKLRSSRTDLSKIVISNRKIKLEEEMKRDRELKRIEKAKETKSIYKEVSGAQAPRA